jgi:hypothetical protein
MTAVVTILITPSIADDVPGVTHRGHTALVVISPANLLSSTPRVVTPQEVQGIDSQRTLPSDLLDLVCQRLC